LIATAFGAAFVLFLISAGINVYQYVEHTNERQARLESTLLRPSRAPQGLPDDPDARELNFARQSRHSLGVSTEDSAHFLAERHQGKADRYVFLDVREHAEQAMGSLRGAIPIRVPDLERQNIKLTDKKVILYCHNGDRSAQAAEAMVKKGIDAVFVVGGLEKWIVEGRDMTGMNSRDLAEFRAAPNYRNRDTLLDTAQVKTLADAHKAIFVDIRHPTDFGASHIPGAINLNLRRLPTELVNDHIAKLPKRPIILPCYDRRGCFFAEALGYELSRAGHDVRGRYTLPWEYFIARGRPPHIEAWNVEQSKSIWIRAASYLADTLSSVSRWTGVVLAILLLATVSRVLVLPFSIKAERDQIRASATTAELEQIKTHLKNDPVRRTRAIRAYYKRHGFTPLRNLLALAFLPVMAIALQAIQEFSLRDNTGFLWVPNLADRDPLYVLPVVFALLISLYVDLAFVTKIKHRVIVWLIVPPAMLVTGLLFGAAANIYLIGSAILLLFQRLWVDGKFAAMKSAWHRRQLPRGVIPLDDMSQLADKGNKAYRLSRMRAAGLPVPNGLLLSPAFLDAFSKSPATRRLDLPHLWNWLGGQRLAVRSSSSGEDGANHSYAGVFESAINVDLNELETAIAKVQSSFTAHRADAYADQAGAGSVLLQVMIQAEYAGVLFTRDPSAGGLAMVEVVQGTAENLVSGVVRPETYRFGRITKLQFGQTKPAIDLTPLLRLGDEAERLFGGPQDIEWAFRDGKFHLVQSRDITRKISGDPETVVLQDDLARAVDLACGAERDTIVFGKNELSEMLPRPTPMSKSLMESLWASGGSVDLAARQLGLSYRVEEDSTLLTTIYGRLYVNKREERARALTISPLAARRLIRGANRIEKDFRETFLPRFLDETRLLTVANFEELSTDELVAEIARLRDRFIFDTHVAVDVINIAASVYLDRARTALQRAGYDPSSFLGHIPETFENNAIAEIATTHSKNRRWLLLKNLGHRAVFDYELAEPRYAEDPSILNRTIAGREQVKRPNYQQSPALSRSLARNVDVARRFQTLKEDAKHHSLRELAILRRAVITLDHRFGLDGNAFYLTFDEILTLSGKTVVWLRELAARRHDQTKRLQQIAGLPATLTAHDLESASAGDLSQLHGLSDVIRGTRVSGSKVVEGRARVVSEDDAEMGRSMQHFREGDIIVATMINPAWLPYFSRAGGFVSEVGGWLSHPAILAREYDVAMLVGTEGIARICEGDLLRLHLDGRIELVGKDLAITTTQLQTRQKDGEGHRCCPPLYIRELQSGR
jgi:rhodanese-related sulfurtransferase/membrane protein insertase Oxa1/YidC/SpoIIIJ/phosphohistidine swiveling domain-containing protein